MILDGLFVISVGLRFPHRFANSFINWAFFVIVFCFLGTFGKFGTHNTEDCLKSSSGFNIYSSIGKSFRSLRFKIQEP